MRYLILFIMLGAFPYAGISADEEPDLSKNANVIIENLSQELILKNEGKAYLKVHIRSKILNSNGADQAVFAEYYDKFRKVRYFEGKIYDANHKEIKKIGYFDLKDQSLINDFSLFEDNRIKYYEPIQKFYPYYVEYTYEIEYRGIMNLPRWQPLNASYTSVKSASFKVTQPVNNPVRYRLINVDSPKVERDNYTLIYNWNIKNLEARKDEPLRLPYALTSPTVYVAPRNFEIDGYSGNMRTWEDFGKWRYNLIKHQSTLPPEVINEMVDIRDSSSDKLEIAQKVYQYMQERTRYVSIQEGIGGWQPFSAETVHSLGYGDCKALTNYTKALLSVAGVLSHYAVIKAGVNESDILTDFPSNQFNHAILCVPMEKDTVWLECTSQTAPFGYLGEFTGNKHALLIKPTGGEIVKTTQYNKDKNFQKRIAKIEIKSDGSASTSLRTDYYGLQYNNVSNYTDKSEKDKKEFLLKKLNISNINLEYYNIGSHKDINPYAFDSITATINSFANTSNSRMFFGLNIFNKNEYVPTALDKRISPIRFTYPYSDLDSVTYILPDGYSVEYLPSDFEAKNEFGEYSISFNEKDNKVVMVRKVSFEKGYYPPSKYEELIGFFEEIVKHDRSKCVLKKDS